MSMIPGMGQSVLTKDNEKEGIKRIKSFLSMMDSMTADELDNIKPLNPSRVYRIARGSGTSVQEVDIMIIEYKRISVAIKGLGRTALAKGKEGQAIQRNP